MEGSFVADVLVLNCKKEEVVHCGGGANRVHRLVARPTVFEGSGESGHTQKRQSVRGTGGGQGRGELSERC